MPAFLCVVVFRAAARSRVILFVARLCLCGVIVARRSPTTVLVMSLVFVGVVVVLHVWGKFRGS